jgi:hypothetical protein
LPKRATTAALQKQAVPRALLITNGRKEKLFFEKNS